MDEILKICAISLVVAIASVVVKKDSEGMGLALRLGGTVVALCGVVGILARLISALCGIVDQGGAGEYFSIMLRALGVCVLCRICADVCRDCNDATAAGAVESAAKLILLLMSLPVVERLVALAGELLERM